MYGFYEGSIGLPVNYSEQIGKWLLLKKELPEPVDKGFANEMCLKTTIVRLSQLWF